ncbi:MAG: zeta toxin family protein [SAR324 cluster bacterium]|nr:zeta toxin family protein [SAR324 cluster bacterium]
MTEAQKPRLIIVAGPNGSGKTTITDKLLRHEWMDDCVYINPDFIAQQEFGDWNSSESVIKAANKAKAIRENCLESMASMAFETVFSSPEKLEFVRRAKLAGFFVRLFFVCTNDPSINAQRVALRVMEGGHDVPIPKIISRYYRSIANSVEALQWVDRTYFYDNSETDADPVLLFRVTDKNIAKIYSDIAPWSQDIIESLHQI